MNYLRSIDTPESYFLLFVTTFIVLYCNMCPNMFPFQISQSSSFSFCWDTKYVCVVTLPRWIYIYSYVHLTIVGCFYWTACFYENHYQHFYHVAKDYNTQHYSNPFPVLVLALSTSIKRQLASSKIFFAHYYCTRSIFHRL